MDSTSVLDRIKVDWKDARLARNTDLAAFLGNLMNDCTKKGRDQIPPRDSSESEVQSVLKQTLDGLVETRDLMKKDLTRIDDGRITKYESEIAIIESYRPQMMSEDAINATFREYIDKNPYGEDAPGTSMKSMKSMMSYISEAHPGAYDGNLASKILMGILKPVK